MKLGADFLATGIIRIKKNSAGYQLLKAKDKKKRPIGYMLHRLKNQEQFLII